MADRKQRLITIHGVNASNWQQDVQPVFGPHFEYRELRYPSYQRWSGAIEVVIARWALFVVFISLIGAFAWKLAAHHQASSVAAIVAAAAFLLGVCLAWIGRRRALRNMKLELDAAAAGCIPAAHVIAHSFGSYLVGRALLEKVDLRLGRLVLVGSVLPRRFNWQEIADTRGLQALAGVRNEVGKRDLVAYLSRLAHPVAWDLGGAGVLGFKGDPTFVHYGLSPVQPCATCVIQRPQARVHNVWLRHFAHSTHFLGVGHAQELWLPFLWGYPPAEFRAWLECCADAVSHRQANELVEWELAVLDLCRRHWSWWLRGEKSLEEYVRERVERRLVNNGRALTPDELDRIVHRAIVRVCVRAEAAYRESWSAEPRKMALVRCLYPPRAIGWAISRTLGEL